MLSALKEAATEYEVKLDNYGVLSGDIVAVNTEWSYSRYIV